MNRNSRKSPASRSEFSTVVKHVLLAVFWTLVTGIPLLFLFSGICFRLSDPTPYVPIFGSALMGILSFVCGWILVKIDPGLPPLFALLGGTLLSLVFWSLRLVFGEASSRPSAISFLLRLLCVLISLLGAMAAHQTKKSKKSRKKPHRRQIRQ